jgi:hypothetical protein
MIVKRIVLFLLSCCYFLLVVAIFFSSSSLAAEFYKPDSAVEIVTESIVDNNFKSSDSARFIAGPVQSDGNAARVPFFHEDSKDALGSLVFSPDDKVIWERHGSTARQFKAKNFLVVPGISVPVDVFPLKDVMANSNSKEFEFEEKLSGRVFVDKIRVSAHLIQAEEAMNAGWVRIKNYSRSSFFLVEARDLATGGLVARQLWSPDSNWWLFEETPFRKSWRVE